SVVIVDSGQEAIAALAEQPFDLVLMQAQMSGMGGPEATSRIRRKERPPGVPIVGLTSDPALQQECLRAGMDGYASRPVNATELHEVIRRCAELDAGPSGVIDWAIALEGFGGDVEMLREVAAMFLEEYPRWLAEVRGAMASEEAGTLKSRAHTLK